MKSKFEMAIALVIALALTACNISEPLKTLPEPEPSTASQALEATSTLDKQAQIEQFMYDDYAKDEYTFENPFIAQNPYGVSPLSALVMFESSADNIIVTIQGSNSFDTVRYECAIIAGRAEVPVYGLFPDQENKVELINSAGESTMLGIKTEPLPEDFPKFETLTADFMQMAPGMTVFSHFTKGLFATDVYGNVRWWINDTPTFGFLGPIAWLENKHMLILGGNMSPPYYMQSVYEIDCLGKVHREYELPANSGHHEIRVMPDGNLLVAIGAPDGSTVEDHIAEIDVKTGEVVKITDLGQCIPLPDYISDPVYIEALIQSGQERSAVEESRRKDWLHNNAFFYDKSDDSIVLSARQLDAVFKIDYASGELIWVLSNPEASWTQTPGIKEKLLAQTGSDFEYQYGQHSVEMLPDGDLLLFDNGCYRSKNWDTIIDDKLNYSRAVRYEIDENSKTAEQIWQYGKERGNELLSCYVSNVEYLGSEHYLINFGGIVFGPDGVRSSDNTLPDSNTSTVIVELKDGEVVYEIKMTSTDTGIRQNTYRAYRVDFS